MSLLLSYLDRFNLFVECNCRKCCFEDGNSQFVFGALGFVGDFNHFVRDWMRFECKVIFNCRVRDCQQKSLQGKINHLFFVERFFAVKKADGEKTPVRKNQSSTGWRKIAGTFFKGENYANIIILLVCVWFFEILIKIYTRQYALRIVGSI